jgi:hypothetical protein
MAREFENVEQVQDILSRGAFDELQGALENELFEVKSAPWDLGSERGKFDFGKDISSLANGRGGIILLGASTSPSPTFQRREIVSIPRVQQTLIPNEQYWHIAGEWIYPPPAGIGIQWHPDPADSTMGLISILVPNYDDELRPFLVARYLPEAGDRIKSVFGLFQRLGPTTKPTPLNELHALLREGRRLDAIHQKLDTIIVRTEGGTGNETTWARIVRMIRRGGGYRKLSN